MAVQQQKQQPDPLDIVHTLGITPGIKRDGTVFETVEFTSGTWCRFQRGVPKKIGGYTRSFQTPNGIPRQLLTQSINGVNYIYTGHQAGIDIFSAGTSQATGAGPYVANFSNNYGFQTIATRPTTTTFTVAGDFTRLYVGGNKVVFADTAAATQYTIQSAAVSGTSPNIITTVTLTAAYAGTPTQVWAVGNLAITNDVRRNWQFDVQYNPIKTNLQVIAHPGLTLQQIDSSLAAPIYSGNVLPDATGTWNFTALSDTEGQNPTGQVISVDGGVVCLYPFIVGYGSNGLLINNNPSTTYNLRTFNDWNGPLANINNVAAGKILRGYPVRGGTSSPSGLFWATDSLVRMSFIAGAGAGNYWQYDLIASKISVMSSNAIVQFDGAFFWMGLDRFYIYNGNVQPLPNDKNSNYLFDNLNYSQRQKVWATTVPRYNEIWWFYPRGSSSECNDAVIFNTQLKVWYDIGQAVGGRRTCGYPTETYNKPFWAGWEQSTTFLQVQYVVTQPSGQPAPTSSTFYLSGDQTPAFAPGNFVSLVNGPTATEIRVLSSRYTFANNNTTYVTLTAPISGAALAVGTAVYPAAATGYPIWAHETGVDRVEGSFVTSIYSSFETNDIGWVGGGPSQDSAQGQERNMRVVRVEPNFVQSGDMKLTFLGKAYPSQDGVSQSDVFSFSPGTGKIDVRNVEFRVLRMRFESDTPGGNYEMGRLLLTLNYGSKRPNG